MTIEVLNIAFYRFVELQNIDVLRVQMRALCSELHLKGTVILSPEGINGFLAGESTRVRQFQMRIGELGPFEKLDFKESSSTFKPFTRLAIKLKKEIIPFGVPGILASRDAAPSISPVELKKWYDEGRQFIALDTRNRYEIEKGTFEGAMDLELKHFRHFPEKLAQLPLEMRQKPVVMFCTGGIRCEKASAYALQAGFKEVYQLQGGILRYFENCQNAHFNGDCFVFDERGAVDSGLVPRPQPQATGSEFDSWKTS